MRYSIINFLALLCFVIGIGYPIYTMLSNNKETVHITGKSYYKCYDVDNPYEKTTCKKVSILDTSAKYVKYYDHNAGRIKSDSKMFFNVNLYVTDISEESNESKQK